MEGRRTVQGNSDELAACTAKQSCQFPSLAPRKASGDEEYLKVLAATDDSDAINAVVQM